jgi:uncharacterized protein (DUF2384 family)
MPMRAARDAINEDRAAVLTRAVAEVARRLQIGPTEVGRIVGISQPTASRIMHGKYLLKDTTKEWELAAHLVRIYRSLFSLVGGDDALARDWLHSPNKAFAGAEPISLLARVDGLLRVAEYLDAHRSRV